MKILRPELTSKPRINNGLFIRHFLYDLEMCSGHGRFFPSLDYDLGAVPSSCL